VRVLLRAAAVLLLAAAADGQEVTAVRTASPPVIDGVLDDPAWEEAVPVSARFILHRPEVGAPMSEPTEIMLLYDDEALYVGAEMTDPHPGEFTRVLTPRDYDVSTEWFGIWLDTFDDNNNCYLFFVSVENVQQDGRLCEVSGWDINWDAVWESATATGDSGWSAEMAIPFSALRFPRTDEQVWGVNFKRTITRTNESGYLFRMADDGDVRISDFGELRGLCGLPAGRQLELRPYGAARVMYLPGGEDGWDPWANAGVDLRVGVSTDAVLDLTANPDYGQVEADPAQVNLSHWETFLTEKRPFFLEGADIFSMPFMLFYSRRIGAVDDRGELIPVLGGAKLTGASGGLRFGVLDACTGRTGGADDPVEPLTNYAAARLVREFGEGTYVGLSATSVDIPGIGDTVYTYGRSGAVEGQVRFLGSHTLHAAAGGTWNSVQDPWEDNRAWRGWYEYEDERWDCDIGFVYREKDFDAGMIGYTSSTGDVDAWADVGLYQPISGSDVLEHAWVNLSGWFDQVPGGPVTGRGAYLETGVVFRNRYHVEFDLTCDGHWFDRYEGPSGREYEGGPGWGASASLDSRRKLYAYAWAGGGSYCDGSSFHAGSLLSYKPVPAVSVDADLTWSTTSDGVKYNPASGEWGLRDTDWRSLELSTDWMLSTDLSLRLTSQISRFHERWDGTGSGSSNGHWANVLLGWRFRPGSMFYLLVGENADPDGDGRYGEPEFTLYSKLTWFLPL
jgi:hypothetical protein